MRRFERELITEWRRLGLPSDDNTIVVAVSGGADSVSLMLALDELKKAKKVEIRIVAAHFNHRLRGDESDADETFVRELTSERKLELAVGRSALSIKTNVEQKARVERYDFLQQTAANLKATAVLTAHDDDRALVVLHNRPGVTRARRGAFGLYHFALLLPDRAALGRFAAHLSAQHIQVGRRITS